MEKIINTIKKRKLLYITIFTLIILVISSKYIISTFSLQEPVKSITITSSNVSYANNDKGSWNIEKSAKWTSLGKARITFDIDTIAKTRDNVYKDVIMVLDVSSSMEGEKIEKVKNDSIDLIESILSDSNNKVALVTFSTVSDIISNFTNDKNSLSDYINSITTDGRTNYYRALRNVETILRDYQSSKDRECIVMFLTDGEPNEETPNEVGQYNYLKDTYPFLTFNGIQYEMGNNILEPIKKISDFQYIASMENLNNVLFQASTPSVAYDKFTVIDYIDTNFFNINSIDSINTSIGKVSLDGNKITWSIDNFKSGSNATMTIDVSLKDEYIEVGGTYPTNIKEEINTKIDEDNENIRSELTPILANRYNVIYEGNAPDGCTVSNVPDMESKSVFETVKISEDKPSCPGYTFKQWKIVTKDVTKVNDDYFTMPESDVIIRAVWSKMGISKSVDGHVAKIQTLYSLMKDQAVMDNIASEHVNSETGIEFWAFTSGLNNGKGIYERAGTENNDYPVYYYRGDIDDNNVIFAGICWKMVVTTETGGVKLLYNGIENEGKCNNTGDASQIGAAKYNKLNNSPAYVGYMYGKAYEYKTDAIGINNWTNFVNKSKTTKNILTKKQGMESTNYYYADNAIWDSEQNKYVLYNSNDLNDTSAPEVTTYNWQNNFNDLIGKYTCFSDTDTSCSKVNYIGGSDSTTAYYFQASNGKLASDYYYISNDISYDENTGKYTLNNPVHIAKTWYSNYSDYIGLYYFCEDLNSTTCNSVYFINPSNATQATLVKLNNGETFDNLIVGPQNMKWIYGNNVTYDGENYTLTNTIAISPVDWGKENRNQIATHHYTCFDTTGTCSKVYYIHYTNSTDVRYIELTDGTKIEDAFLEMFGTNTIPNNIKGTDEELGIIDTWYANNLAEYTDEYIEDTVYCNDRTFYDKGGWDPNGESITNPLYFGAHSRLYDYNPSIVCPRNVDKFTVSDKIGNGLLKYPVGLLTSDEVIMAGVFTDSPYYLDTGKYWWTMTPYYVNAAYPLVYYLDPNVNKLGGRVVTWDYGIRPVISIKNSIKVYDGDGTSDNPYTIEKNIYE